MIEIETLRGLDAHRSADAELVARMNELEAEAAGRPFGAEQKAEFEGILSQRETLKTAIDELELRDQAIKDAMAQDNQVARPAAPNIVRKPENLFDLAAYRQRVNDVAELPLALRDGAMRVVEQLHFPIGKADAHREQLAKLIEKHRDEDYGAVSRRIIGTSSPAYIEAWAAKHTGKPLTDRLQAVMQSYSDADGGFALPVQIDPTFINTSDGSVNPLRSMARVETITGKSWQAVTTAGVTAAYVGERTTTGASDSAPTDIDDPTATPVRADVALDVTMEYLADYGSAALLSELGSLIAAAKDDLEADKFVMGDGSGEPDGVVAALITDTTSIVPTATSDVFVLADIDALIAALGARFRARAQFMANLAILQIIRGFGTAGQPAGSIYDPVSKILRGYPANESTAMDDTVADAKEILLFGDFGRGFVIVDRLGLSTRVVDSRDTNGRPTGNSTIYAAWRNTSKLLFPNAFRLLKVA